MLFSDKIKKMAGERVEYGRRGEYALYCNIEDRMEIREERE